MLLRDRAKRARERTGSDPDAVPSTPPVLWPYGGTPDKYQNQQIGTTFTDTDGESFIFASWSVTYT